MLNKAVSGGTLIFLCTHQPEIIEVSCIPDSISALILCWCILMETFQKYKFDSKGQWSCPHLTQCSHNQPTGVSVCSFSSLLIFLCQRHCSLCVCAVFSQVCDSDTVLDPACTIEMLKILEEDPMVGGVGGDVQVKYQKPKYGG